MHFIIIINYTLIEIMMHVHGDYQVLYASPEFSMGCKFVGAVTEIG